MKSLKFYTPLAKQIEAGDKWSTWRLFDDKNLQAGDEVMFINKDTGDQFGAATLTDVQEKTLGTLTDEDWEGHEHFASEEEMYSTYRQYYSESVGPETVVKIIQFRFQKLTK